MILTNLLRDAGEETGKDFQTEARRREKSNAKSGRTASLRRLTKGAGKQGLLARNRVQNVRLGTVDLEVLKAIATNQRIVERPAALTKRNFKKAHPGVRFVSDTKAGTYFLTRKAQEPFSIWEARQPGKVRVTPIGLGFRAEFRDQKGNLRQFETSTIRSVSINPDGATVITKSDRERFTHGRPIALHHYAAWKVDGEMKGFDLAEYADAKEFKVLREWDQVKRTLLLTQVKNGQLQKTLRFEHHAAFYVKDDRVHALPESHFSADQIAKSQNKLMRGGLIEPASVLDVANIESSLLTEKGQRLLQERLAISQQSAGKTKLSKRKQGSLAESRLKQIDWQVLRSIADEHHQELLESPEMAVQRFRDSQNHTGIRFLRNQTALRYLLLRKESEPDNAVPVASLKAKNGAQKVPEPYETFRQRFARTTSITFSKKNGILTGTLNESFKVPYKRRAKDEDSAYTKTYPRLSKSSVVLDKVYWWDGDAGRIQVALSEAKAGGPILHAKAVIAYRLQPGQMTRVNREFAETLHANPRLAKPVVHAENVLQFLRKDHQVAQPSPMTLDRYFRFRVTSQPGQDGEMTFTSPSNHRQVVEKNLAGYFLNKDGKVVAVKRKPVPPSLIQRSLTLLRAKQWVEGEGKTLAGYKLTKAGALILDLGAGNKTQATQLVREKRSLRMVAEAVGFIPEDLLASALRPRLKKDFNPDFEKREITTHTGARLKLLVPRKEKITFKRAELGHEYILAHGMKKLHDKLLAEGAKDIRFVSERELRRAQTRQHQGQVNPWHEIELQPSVWESDPIKGIPDGVFLYRDKDGEPAALAVEADAGGSVLANSQGYSEGTLSMKDGWAANRGMGLAYVVGPRARAQTIQNGRRQVFWLEK